MTHVAAELTAGRTIPAARIFARYGHTPAALHRAAFLFLTPEWELRHRLHVPVSARKLMEHKRDIVGATLATIIVAPVILVGVAYLILNLAIVTQLLSQDLLQPPTVIPVRFE